MSSEINFFDKLAGKSLERLSVAGLGPLVGLNKPPREPDNRWWYTGLAASLINNWQEFDGYSQSGFRPIKYELSATITIEKAVLDDLQDKRGGHQAVFYAFGTAVMCGTVDRPKFLGEDPHDPSRYIVGMGIGKGVLKAAIGLRAENGDYVVPHTGMGKKRPTPTYMWPNNMVHM